MESDFLCAVYGLSGVNSGLTQVINLHCKYSILLGTNQNCSPVSIVLSIRYSACCDVLLLLLFFLLLLIVS